MIKRRPIEVFSLSFLDCLCCGFGAILLLFLLSIGSGKAGVESEIQVPTIEEMRSQLAQLEADIANKAARLDAAVNSESIRMERERILSAIQELESELSDLQQEHDTLQAGLSTSEKAAAEAKRLLRSFQYEDLPPIGLPAESTHVAFVIDTSGSMRNQVTGQLHEGVIAQIRELLDSLPQVRAIQFIDSSGNYMLSQKRGFWLPDSPGLRSQALSAIRNYPYLSVSDPAPGINRAFRDLRGSLSANESMSIYMLGDDFRGSTNAFLVKLNSLNPRSQVTGKRAVSISAVGFPTLVNPFQLGNPQGNVRFANIMREVAEEHDGVLILKPRI